MDYERALTAFAGFAARNLHRAVSAQELGLFGFYRIKEAFWKEWPYSWAEYDHLLIEAQRYTDPDDRAMREFEVYEKAFGTALDWAIADLSEEDGLGL